MKASCTRSSTSAGLILVRRTVLRTRDWYRRTTSWKADRSPQRMRCKSVASVGSRGSNDICTLACFEGRWFALSTVLVARNEVEGKVAGRKGTGRSAPAAASARLLNTGLRLQCGDPRQSIHAVGVVGPARRVRVHLRTALADQESLLFKALIKQLRVDHRMVDRAQRFGYRHTATVNIDHGHNQTVSPPLSGAGSTGVQRRLFLRTDEETRRLCLRYESGRQRRRVPRAGAAVISTVNSSMILDVLTDDAEQAAASERRR